MNIGMGSPILYYMRDPGSIKRGPQFNMTLEHFQNHMSEILADLDDILVYGKTKLEHDQRLKEVLQ